MGRPKMRVGARGSVNVHKLAPLADGTKRFQARVRIRDEDGLVRQVAAVGTTQTQAKAALEDAVAERTGPRAGPMTADTEYREVAKKWLAEVHRNSARTTYDTYASIMNSIVLPRIGALRFRELTGATLSVALDNLSGHYTPNGRRQIRKVMSGPLEMAREMGLIPRNPIRDLGKIKGRSPGPRALTADEQSRLLAFLDTDERCRELDVPDLIRFLLGTGCRIGEALGMRWVDLDLERGRCHVSGSLIRVRGEGVQRAIGKTDHANRHLWMPETLTLALRMRWDGRDMVEDMPVFPSSTGTWRDPNNLQRTVRYVRANVEGLDWITTHTFRRTVATMLDEAGMSARQIADHLGHARPSMSQDNYIARGSGPREAALALAGRDLSRPPPR